MPVGLRQPLLPQLQKPLPGLINLPFSIHEVRVLPAHEKLPEPPQHHSLHRRVRVSLPQHNLQIVRPHVLVLRRHVKLREPNRDPERGQFVELRPNNGPHRVVYVALYPEATHGRPLGPQAHDLSYVLLGRRARVAPVLHVVVVNEEGGGRVEPGRGLEHFGPGADPETVLVERAVQHLVVHVVVLELALVAREESREAVLDSCRQVGLGEGLDPRLDGGLDLPEDAVAAARDVMGLAQGEDLVGVPVVELVLLGLGPVPLELVAKDGPVKVGGEKFDKVLVVDEPARVLESDEIDPGIGTLHVNHHLCSRLLDSEGPTNLVPLLIVNLHLAAIRPLAINTESNIHILRSGGPSPNPDPRGHLISQIEFDFVGNHLGGTHPCLSAFACENVAATQRHVGVCSHGRKNAW
ncbi:mediator of RNA polymerase II transcription subunit [Striga asiatica]|uniref:Mediator of RNA polymerase II transcription subunit n=1 Tax=Striga asiatica TaxID=4170 RepID=A0A5A7QIA9_STRAF|nr:mediator of RNA polymerase II transcription subunit [Striga asiatica]